MSKLSILPFLAFAGAIAVAQTPTPKPTDPPGFIVIKPKLPDAPKIDGTRAPVTELKPGNILTLDPNAPGFYVVRPNGSGTLPQPREGVPHLEIVRSPGQTGPATTRIMIPDLPVPEPVVRKDETIVFESWDAAFCRGYKVGYFHVVVQQSEKNGKKYLHGTKTMRLTVARFGQVVEMWAEDSTLETLDGQVLVTQMRQGIGKDQALALTGTVEGKKLSVTIENQGKDKQEIAWPEGVTGVAKEATLIRDQKPKSGAVIEFISYEGRLNRVIKYTATVKDAEMVVVGDGQKPRSLIPIIKQMEAIGDFKLPPATVWVDAKTFEDVKMESDMPTLGGKLTVVRTTRDAALKNPTRYLDLAEAQSIKLNRTVNKIHQGSGVNYRITLAGDSPVDKAFPSDLRQELKNVDVKLRTVEVHTKGLQSPKKPEIPPVAPDKEFLSNCFFIDWDSDLVKKHAAAAIANLPARSDDWDKARAVERWVSANIKSTEFSQAMATCANVAKTLSGDCTEYSVLAVGMCRALGIPSRTAIGVVYAPDRNNQPTLAYHMWFEVWIQGQWMSLDGTLGMGGIGPGHIKISDASWHEEKSFGPLLPVLTILGTSPKVEIIKVNESR